MSELEAENEGLRQKGSASESKLHTIMEEMSNMEPTVSSCSRAEDRCALELSEVVQEQLMEPYPLPTPSWEQMLDKVSCLAMEYR